MTQRDATALEDTFQDSTLTHLPDPNAKLRPYPPEDVPLQPGTQREVDHILAALECGVL
jgi:hypothetical protein